MFWGQITWALGTEGIGTRHLYHMNLYARYLVQIRVIYAGEKNMHRLLVKVQRTFRLGQGGRRNRNLEIKGLHVCPHRSLPRWKWAWFIWKWAWFISYQYSILVHFCDDGVHTIPVLV